MIDRFVRWLFWDRPLGPGQRAVWFLLFCTAPLAYLAAYHLQVQGEDAHLMMHGSREQLIQQARQFVMVHGLDVREWGAAVAVERNLDRDWLRQQKPGESTQALLAMMGQVKVEVTFLPANVESDADVRIRIGPGPNRIDEGGGPGGGGPGGGGPGGGGPGGGGNQRRDPRASRVEFSSDGRIVNWHIPSGVSPSYVGTSQLAEEDLDGLTQQFPDLRLRTAREEAIIENGENIGSHIFTEAYLDGRPDVKLRIHQEVRRGLLLGRHISHEVEGGRPAQNIAVPIVLGIITLLYLYLSALALASYVRQSFHREAGHSRALLVLALTALFQFAYSYGSYISGSRMELESSGANSEAWLVIVALLFVSLCIGAWLGVFYGAAENELRRHHPGILTSLDALLSGNLISRQTGRSILIGLAAGGWVTLGSALVREVFFPGGFAPMSESMMTLVYAPNPTFLALVNPLYSIFFSVLPSVMPLVFLERWSARWLRERRWPAYVGAGLLMTAVHLVFREDVLLGPANIGVGIWTAVVVLYVLLRVDLLACTFLLIVEGTHLLHLPFGTGGDALQMANWITLTALLATTAFGLYCALRGPILSDEEVRPGYARKIALREQRRGELKAARDAQQRLLPLKTPTLAGLRVARLFWPSRMVGGDFYDFFVLSPAKLGILVAEGNGRGLDAAMTMALAKGYLSERVKSGVSPADALESLLLCGGASELLVVGEEASIGGLCYAEIDAATQSWRYARVGEWPQVSVSGRPPLEGQSLSRGIVLYTAAGSFSSGEQIDIFSDGFSRQWSLREPRKWLAEQLSAELPLDGQVANLLGRRQQGPVDDLTLIRIAPERAQQQGSPNAEREGQQSKPSEAVA